MFGLSIRCIYTVVTSRGRQRVEIRAIQNNESLFRSNDSIDSKFRKASFLH